MALSLFHLLAAVSTPVLVFAGNLKLRPGLTKRFSTRPLGPTCWRFVLTATSGPRSGEWDVFARVLFGCLNLSGREQSDFPGVFGRSRTGGFNAAFSKHLRAQPQQAIWGLPECCNTNALQLSKLENPSFSTRVKHGNWDSVFDQTFCPFARCDLESFLETWRQALGEGPYCLLETNEAFVRKVL